MACERTGPARHHTGRRASGTSEPGSTARRRPARRQTEPGTRRGATPPGPRTHGHRAGWHPARAADDGTQARTPTSPRPRPRRGRRTGSGGRSREPGAAAGGRAARRGPGAGEPGRRGETRRTATRAADAGSGDRRAARLGRRRTDGAGVGGERPRAAHGADGRRWRSSAQSHHHQEEPELPARHNPTQRSRAQPDSAGTRPARQAAGAGGRGAATGSAPERRTAGSGGRRGAADTRRAEEGRGRRTPGARGERGRAEEDGQGDGGGGATLLNWIYCGRV